jgi:hypothetical protein
MFSLCLCVVSPAVLQTKCSDPGVSPRETIVVRVAAALVREGKWASSQRTAQAIATAEPSSSPFWNAFHAPKITEHDK